MTRLLTTVAVSALILSVAAPGLRAADTPSTGMPQSGVAAPINQAQTNPAPMAQAPATQAQTTQTPTAQAPVVQAQTSPMAVKPQQVAHRTWHRQDHIANELNRQELARLNGTDSSNYGSSR
jgi:pyruvate/2-oxoglutarate dehydrogenase complex dihydrolipoamide acyltransferase (E2) component